MYSAESARVASGRVLDAVQAEFDEYRAVAAAAAVDPRVIAADALAVAEAFARAADVWSSYRATSPLAAAYRRISRAWREEAETYAAAPVLAGWS